jgi:hypothetical protein
VEVALKFFRFSTILPCFVAILKQTPTYIILTDYYLPQTISVETYAEYIVICESDVPLLCHWKAELPVSAIYTAVMNPKHSALPLEPL